jgi:Putative Ig domain
VKIFATTNLPKFKLALILLLCVIILSFSCWSTKTADASADFVSTNLMQTTLTITTQQARFLNGVQNAPWGPVLLKATGGSQPYSWQKIAGTLPSGITLTSAGRLEGTPTTVGYYDFTVKVTDSFARTAQSSYRIRINTLSEVKHPPLKSTELPFGYIQSAFFVGTGQSAGSQDKEQMKAFIRMFQKKFAGGEIYLTSLENATDFADARQVNQAIAEVRAEPGGKDFIGLFGNGRFPNFSRHDDLSFQPASYRAVSLKSDGSEWTREPFAFDSGGSLFGIESVAVDITNDQAVKDLLDNLTTAYDQEGAPDQSVGPLNGFYVFNEPRVSPIYLPFTKDPAPPDNDDLVPKTSGPVRSACQWANITSNPPMLRYGDPCQLYAAGDPRFNWLAGPRRSVPLYSASARDKFVQYAAARGLSVSKLPADRNEFNDLDSQVSLPLWVEFVPRTNTAVWDMWEAWVYETWSKYLEKVARTISFAQAGNPNFRGVIYFQFAGMNSFRSPVKDELFKYQYYDGNDVLQTSADVRLRDFPKYSQFNNPVHGNDMEMIIKSPWIQGLVHETTVPLQGVAGSSADRNGDRRMLTTPEGIFQWNQESEMSKRVAHRYNKFFGLFARYSYFSPGDQLIWVEDSVPQGAIVDGATDGWNWVSSNPSPQSGTLAHQSAIGAGIHQHLFYNAPPLTVESDDLLVAYVYLDPANPPQEVMLQWNDGTWEHRAYWGQNLIPWGVNGTNSRRNMGPLPSAGQWVRLEVPGWDVGLSGSTVNGIAFTLYGGRATWDHAGKMRRNSELTSADWSWNWDRLMPLYIPDIVSTLPPGYYVNVDDMEASFKYLVPPKDGSLNVGLWPGDLGPAWLSKMGALSTLHTHPPEWNPRSTGTVDTFNGTTATGWAYDPWSTTTLIAVFVAGSPNGCYTGPTRIGYVTVNGDSSLARDTSIRNSIKSSSNYIPREDAKFEYSVDLVSLLKSKGVVCQAGNYQVQMRVQDGQGDALTSLLLFNGSGTLTVPATP